MATDDKNTPDTKSSNGVRKLSADFRPSPRALAVSPLGAALNMLAGVDPFSNDPRVQTALHALWETVEALRSPGVQGDRWLRAMARELQMPGPDFFRAAMLGLVRSLLKKAPEPGKVQAVLAEFVRCDEFLKLTDEQVKQAWKLRNPDKTTGATNYGPPAVCAELTLQCGAFGDCKRPRDSHATARARITKVFNSAWRREHTPKG